MAGERSVIRVGFDVVDTFTIWYCTTPL